MDWGGQGGAHEEGANHDHKPVGDGGDPSSGVSTHGFEYGDASPFEAGRDPAELALEATNTVIWEVDLETDSVSSMGPFERVGGVPPEEIDDLDSIASLSVHPDDQERVSEAFEAVFTGTAQSVDIEHRTHPENGPVRWLRMQSMPMEDDGEATPTLLAGISTDITPLKEREEQLEAFTGFVAHDLRNPLTAARAWLTLAEEEEEPEALQRVDASLDRMENFVSELLTLARAGKAIGTTESVALSELVAECWDTVDTGNASLAIETDRTVEADRMRLGQLFENLFRNAVEHNPDGISVTVGDLPDGFFVEDDGQGLPPDQLESLFATESGDSKAPTGLGLLIIEEVVEGHGWEIDALPGATGGVRFEVTGVSIQ